MADGGDTLSDFGLPSDGYWSLLITRDQRILTGTYDGRVVEKSLSDTSWSVSHTGTFNRVLSLAETPDGFIFAGTFEDGIVRRSPDDTGWTILPLVNVQRVSAILVDSTVAVYVGCNQGIFRSTNNGDSWELFGLSNFPVVSLHKNPDGHIFAGTDTSHGLFVTRNGGVSWENLGLQEYETVTTITTGPDGSLFVGTFGGLLRLDPDSPDWKLVGLSPAFLYPITFSPTGILYGAIQETSVLFKSSDEGATWKRLLRFRFSPQWSEPLYAVAVDQNDIVYVGWAGGIERSTDQGTSWTTVWDGSYAKTLFVDNSNKLYFGSLRTLTSEAVVMSSVDSGNTWTLIGYGTNGFNAIAKNSQGQLYVASTEGIYKSTNDGLEWNLTGMTIEPFAFVIDQQRDRFYAVLRDSGIYVSANGDHWTSAGILGEAWRSSLVVDHQGGVWATLFENNLFRSTDFGATWETPTQGIEAPAYFGAVTYGPNERIYLSAKSAIYRGPHLPTSIKDNQEHIPGSFSLGQPYPNPFNGTVNLDFQIGERMVVELRMFDLLGRELITLLHEEKDAGRFKVAWDPGHLPSGIYFLRMQAGSFAATRKVALVR